MSVHVDELTSEVQVEPGAAGPAEPPTQYQPARWDEEERYRLVRDRLVHDLARVAAEGFDD